MSLSSSNSASYWLTLAFAGVLKPRIWVSLSQSLCKMKGTPQAESDSLSYLHPCCHGKHSEEKMEEQLCISVLCLEFYSLSMGLGLNCMGKDLDLGPFLHSRHKL